MQADALQYCKEVLEQGRSASSSELHFALDDILDPVVIDLFISNAAGNCATALRGLIALLDLDLSAERAVGAAPQLSSAANTQQTVPTKQVAALPKAFDGAAAATPRERQALTKQAVAAMQGSFESHDNVQQAAPTAATHAAVATPQLQTAATAQQTPAPAPAPAIPRAAPADMFASFIMQYASSQNSNSSCSNSSSTTQQRSQPVAVTAPFVTPVQLPAGVQGPSSERQHTIIQKTAEKVAAQPGFEVYLNAQSSRAPVMAFMAKDHPLHAYYLGELFSVLYNIPLQCRRAGSCVHVTVLRAADW
jgi:pyruvate/2-oxoglutarate dehydrogenase complex dihydrolipoamide acyltransferase (E2) component